MTSNTSKKRSFDTFESNQNDIGYPANKKHKKNKKNKKNKKAGYNFFDIRFTEPDDDDFDIKKAHCLEFRNLLSIMEENHLYGLIKNELNKWYESKLKNKNSNTIDMNGKIDIHLFHNRHNSGITGFCYVYFENKCDASYIVQLSNQNKLKNKNRKIICEWKENEKDKDSYSSIYQTDINLKGDTNMIKISNLHWKTTMLHLYQLFNSLGEDFHPKYIKIMEDKNGFPKSQALIMLNNNENVIHCIDKLQNHRLLGRKIKMEYSSYLYQGQQFMNKYNENNSNLAGISNKLLLSNIKQSVKTSDIKRFLKENININDIKNYEEIINDIYLIHNINKICSGKCFIEFNNTENAKLCFDKLYLKQLCHRTVFVEYGHLHNEYEQHCNQNLKNKTNRLFISNLAWDVKEKDIKRFFGHKVVINNIYFNITPNGFPKGSAFITFDGFDVASKAFDQSNGKKLKNRAIKLDFAELLEFANDNYN